MTFRRVSFSSTALVTFILLGSAVPAAAQNSDGQHQVRFGVFGQTGPTSGTAANPAGREDYSIFTYGIGASAGLEWVRKQGWSWGVEMDGTVLAGNDSGAGNELSPNYLATLRVRGGRHIRSDLFWYGTIGAGYLGMESKTSSIFGLNKVADSKAGLVLGTGLEWDYKGALIAAEYLYGDFGTFTSTAANHRYDADMHIFRLGVKFKVGHDHYDDDVARRIGRIGK